MKTSTLLINASHTRVNIRESASHYRGRSGTESKLAFMLKHNAVTFNNSSGINLDASSRARHYLSSHLQSCRQTREFWAINGVYWDT